MAISRRNLLLGVGAAGVAPARRRVVLSTRLGVIRIDLAIGAAPLSGSDFLKYVAGGYYDGGRFFRVVRPDNDRGHPLIDVVQGGIRNPKQAWAPIAHETTRQTGLRHLNGTVSLPRDKPGTGSGAEIFICIGDQPALDFGGHAQPGQARLRRLRPGIGRHGYRAPDLAKPCRCAKRRRLYTGPNSDGPHKNRVRQNSIKPRRAKTEGSSSFLKKKNQKTFASEPTRCRYARASEQKFFGSFFQKRTASSIRTCHNPPPCAAQHFPLSHYCQYAYPAARPHQPAHRLRQS